jgi:AraC-like DNA-binding protein
LIGEQSPHLEWRRSTGTSSHILAFPADDLFEVVSQPGFHGDTVSIPEDRVRSVAELMGFPDPLEEIANGLAFVEIDPRRQAALRRAASRLHAMVTALGDGPPNATAAADMEFDIGAALVAALQSSRSADAETPEPVLRARAINRALEYIENHADAPPSVEDICRASGVSWRTLNYAFRDRFGITPKQYLQATRMQRVRREILCAMPETSILEIAARWGFWHMGQFAADYRRQFGELPSETAQRSRPE